MEEEEAEEKNGEGGGVIISSRPIETYSDLISTLPLGCFGLNLALRQLHGFWFPEGLIPGVLSARDNFLPRPDDIFLECFPKSGTTWTEALMFAAMTRSQHPPAAKNHPFLTRNPHECVPYLEDILAAGRDAELEALPSPRIINTHIPYSLLPAAVTGSCRIVYVCRDPKDVLVSFSNFPLVGVAMPPDPLAAMLVPFCEGVIPYGPTWEHVLEFWRESQRRPEKVLLLKYEEMMQDPAGNLKKLAEFMGCPFSPEEEKQGMVEDIVCLCSFKKLKELEVNKDPYGMQGNIIKIHNASFFRKGQVGDWKNHMTFDMANKIDQIVQSKWQGCNLGYNMATT